MCLSAWGSSSTASTRTCASARPCEERIERGATVTGEKYPSCSTVGIVKVKRAPRPIPSLSAQMRPPCASTIPLLMARPSPVVAPPILGFYPGELPKQVGQAFRQDAPAVVGYRHGHMDPILRGAHPDGGRLRRVSGRVGDQVAQHLDHAWPVSHHPGNVRRQFDVDMVTASAATEGIPGIVHKRGNIRRSGRNRKRTRLDASHVQQVAYQQVHPAYLGIDDLEELPPSRWD